MYERGGVWVRPLLGRVTETFAQYFREDGDTYEAAFLLTLPSEIRLRKREEEKVLTRHVNWLAHARTEPRVVDGITQYVTGCRMVPVIPDSLEDVYGIVGIAALPRTTFPVPQVSPEFARALMRGSIEEFEDFPSRVFADIVAKLDHYLDMPREYLELFALYIMGTYFYELFDAYPILYVFGMWQSGKTKILTLIERLAFNGYITTDITSASMFRLTQDFGLTLCIDESDELREGETREQLKAVLRNRYKKDSGRVLRVNSDTFTVETFRVYGPTVVANVSGLEVMLYDRSIRVVPLRGKDAERMNRWPASRDEFMPIRDRLHALMLTDWPEVARIYRTMTDVWFVGREWEIWKPMATMAHYVAGTMREDEAAEFLTRIRRFAEELVEAKRLALAVDQPELRLLAALLELVREPGWFPLSVVVQKIAEMSAPEERDEVRRAFTSQRLGRWFSRFGFERKRRMSGGIQYYLEPEKVRDVAERHGIAPSGEQAALDAVRTETPAVCELCGREARERYLKNGRYVCPSCYEEVTA